MVPLIVAGAAAGLAGQLGGAAISGYYSKEASKREANERKDAANKLLQEGKITDSQYQELINQIDQYYATRGSLGTKQDVNQYKAAIQGYNPEDYVADVGDFSDTYNKTQEDFVNPYYAQIIGDTRDTIQHSAAGAGLGRGTGAALNIAKGTAEKSDELYRTAQEAYRDDRNFAYQQYIEAINNNQNRLNALGSGTEYKLGLQGDLAQDYYNTRDSQMSDIMQAQQDRLNAKAGYASAIAGLY